MAAHFGLAKFSLLGHSMGGAIACLFAATHPDLVAALVMLDVVKPISRNDAAVAEKTRAAVDDLLAVEAKLEAGPTPSFGFEEAKARWIKGQCVSLEV